MNIFVVNLLLLSISRRKENLSCLLLWVAYLSKTLPVSHGILDDCQISNKYALYLNKLLSLEEDILRHSQRHHNEFWASILKWKGVNTSKTSGEILCRCKHCSHMCVVCYTLLRVSGFLKPLNPSGNKWQWRKAKQGKIGHSKKWTILLVEQIDTLQEMPPQKVWAIPAELSNSITVHPADGCRPKARTEKEMTFTKEADRFKSQNKVT